MLKNQKISVVQTLLTVLYVVSLLISNILAAKQFVLFGSITMTCAVMIFPITYILSDVFSEVYGYKWSRLTCYTAFAANLLMVLFFQLSILTPAPDYWLNQAAYETVLGSVPRVLFGSLLAFVIGDFVNDKVFSKMKKKQEGLKGFGARAVLSSFAGEVVDSAIFLPIAFIGTMPAKTLLIMGVTQVTLKVLYECLILPLTHFIAKVLLKSEQKEDQIITT